MVLLYGAGEPLPVGAAMGTEAEKPVVIGAVDVQVLLAVDVPQ